MEKLTNQRLQGSTRSLDHSESTSQMPDIQDNRQAVKIQLKQMDAINNSALMASQLKRQQYFPDSALQRMESPEEELQLKADPLQKMDGVEEEELQLKVDPLQKMDGLEEEELQLKANPLQKMDDLEEETQLKQAPIQRNTTGMPDGVKTKMENTFNQDFSNVTIHDNSSAAPAAGALAFAQGTDVHFAPGQFKPETTQGQQLLGHELTHVVQQSEGRVKPTTEVMGMPVNDDPKLEAEADAMGKKAAS